MKSSNHESIFQKYGEITYSALGSMGQLKIVNILNLLQDTAAEHASLLKISGFDLAKKNLAWVISKYRIKILSNPPWLEKLLIKTWRFPWKNLYELRHFQITGKNGAEIINATAAWVMVKKSNGLPVRLSRYLEKEMYTNNSTDITDPFHDLKKIEKIDFQLPFKIRMQDLDLNRHVNNAIYVGWAVETVPEDILNNFIPEKIDVLFQKESFYGDKITSKTEITEKNHNPLTLHSIISNNSKRELAFINILWKPME
ncbi:MAG: thioesterase [Thermodesulfobacteriota bacterium]|nr:thioesterase [Thermodesulfobacteriota bacterium]